MNTTYVHLVLNHISILGAIFSILILIGGIIKNNPLLIKIALVGFVISALAALPVFFTGEDAEEAVENIPGVLKSVIESHEESAEISIWLIGALGAFSLIGLVFQKANFSAKKYFTTGLLLLSFVAAGTISYTGFLGGKIRHTEVAGNTIANQSSEQVNESDED